MIVRQAYDNWSHTYDSDLNRTRDLDGSIARTTFTRPAFDLIVEVGCGTGKNTPLYARAGKRVHAIDFSEGMIRQAREKVVADNVIFSVADITKPWPCDDATADLVVFHLVLEHIENLEFVLSEASRVLVERGRVFISELHPYRQYQGVKANFQQGTSTTTIPAFVHNISDFLAAALHAGLSLASLQEWWHEEDKGKPPRIVSLMFEK
jgi:ubiquinone/menaquinone biosynthesis C-methylase UbiE